jgi:hypothetical protein
MRAKVCTQPKLVIARQIHVLQASSEEQDAWDASLLGAPSIRAIHTCAP